MDTRMSALPPDFFEAEAAKIETRAPVASMAVKITPIAVSGTPARSRDTGRNVLMARTATVMLKLMNTRRARIRSRARSANNPFHVTPLSPAVRAESSRDGSRMKSTRATAAAGIARRGVARRPNAAM